MCFEAERRPRDYSDNREDQDGSLISLIDNTKVVVFTRLEYKECHKGVP